MNELDARLSARLLDARAPWQKTTLRRAAVLAPIVRHDGEDALLFVVRPQSMRKHAGQIAFPGGAADDIDDTPSSCALRETLEEIGVDSSLVTLLGSLPSATSSSNYRVHCVVGRIQEGAAIAIDPIEVARTLIVPLREMLPRDRWTERRGDSPGAERFPPSPHFAIGDDVLWGLTGRFTAALLDAIREDRAT
jgi:8-oxo-dGTP pyrophosphatase MutT (NUDIX family)